jgi:hypothetical protein
MSSPIPSSAPTTPSKSPLKRKASAYTKKSIALSKRRKLEGRTPVQGATSTETGEGENRYPSERSKITRWADEYMALGERTPSEFAAFQRGQDMENFENSEDSLPSYTSQVVPSPCTPSKSQSTSSGVITIRYENHIIFSSSPNSKGTPQEIIRQAALTARNKTVGSLISITEEHTAGAHTVGAPSKRPPSPLQKFKIIDLNLEYTVDDIPEIPTTAYNAQNYHLIPQDWEASAHLVIRGVPIPLKYWAEIYQKKPTAEYEYRRNKWKLWKVGSRKPVESSEFPTYLLTPF